MESGSAPRHWVPDPRRGRVIALLGAESTGKSTLARELQDALAGEGHDVTLVEEYLREFCNSFGRTPYRHEQQAIAHEQSERIERAASDHELVIADTTALMIAVYSDIVFADPSLYASALRAHSVYDLALLTSIDLPWQADGHQRDGPHVQGPVDDRVRDALSGAEFSYSVVCGTGAQRLANALTSVRRALTLTDRQEAIDSAPPRWTWICERCGDPNCERHPLAR